MNNSENHTYKSLYIPIEIKHRELNSKILLGFEMAQKGFSTYIGSKASIENLIQSKKTKSGIFFYKSEFIVPKMMDYVTNKFDHLVILDEEAGPMIDDETLVKRANMEILSKCSLFFTYNENHKKKICESHKKMCKKVIASGWIRELLLSNEYINLYSETTYALKKKYGKFCLFISSFGINNNNTLKKYEKRNDKDNLKLLNHYLNKYNEFIDWLSINSHYFNFKLIIRPHAEEDLIKWKNDTRHFNNVKVVYKHEITPWILTASAILSLGSTSVKTAISLRKKVGLIKMNQDSFYYKMKFDNIPFFDSYNEINNWFNNGKNLSNLYDNNHVNDSLKIITTNLNELNLSREIITKPSYISRLTLFIKKTLKYLDKMTIFYRRSKWTKMTNGINIYHFKNFLLKYPDTKIKKLASDLYVIYEPKK